jgi:hypothetical protein
MAPASQFRVGRVSLSYAGGNGYLSAKEIISHHNATLAGPFVTLATTADWRFYSEK